MNENENEISIEDYDIIEKYKSSIEKLKNSISFAKWIRCIKPINGIRLLVLTDYHILLFKYPNFIQAFMSKNIRYENKYPYLDVKSIEINRSQHSNELNDIVKIHFTNERILQLHISRSAETFIRIIQRKILNIFTIMPKDLQPIVDIPAEYDWKEYKNPVESIEAFKNLYKAYTAYYPSATYREEIVEQIKIQLDEAERLSNEQNLEAENGNLKTIDLAFTFGTFGTSPANRDSVYAFLSAVIQSGLFNEYIIQDFNIGRKGAELIFSTAKHRAIMKSFISNQVYFTTTAFKQLKECAIIQSQEICNLGMQKLCLCKTNISYNLALKLASALGELKPGLRILSLQECRMSSDSVETLLLAMTQPSLTRVGFIFQ